MIAKHGVEAAVLSRRLSRIAREDTRRYTGGLK